MKIKELRETRNELLSEMREIHESNSTLDDEQEARYNELKQEVEAKNTVLARQEFLETQRADEAVRNTEDGESKELRNFSFKDAVAYATNPGSLSNKKQGFYNEMNAEAVREAQNAGVTLQGGPGIVIPQKVLNATTTSADIVETGISSNFIDALKERTQMIGLGAELLDGLVGNVKFSKEDATADEFTWEGETDQNQEGNSTFKGVDLSAKRGSVFVDVSNQVLKQTSPSIEGRIRRQLEGAVSRGLEKSAIVQANAQAPLGIMDLSGNDLSETNGGVTSWHDLVIDLETEVSADNADLGSLAYYTNSKVRGKLKKEPITTGSDRFILEGKELNGYPVAVSNLVASDFAQGTGTGLDAILFGNFANVLFGMWAIEIISDPYTQARNGMTRMTLNVFSDIAVLQENAFSFAKVDLS